MTADDARHGAIRPGAIRQNDGALILAPVQALKKWHAEKPELFVKRVYNQPGLDS